MMTETPPRGSQERPDFSQPIAASSRPGISFDRGYIFSIAGILTAVAVINAFIAMVAIEAGKTQFFHWRDIDPQRAILPWGADAQFHEFTSITSWVLLLTFTIVSTLQIYRKLNIGAAVMKFVMLGHSTTWALLLLISSSILLNLVSGLKGDEANESFAHSLKAAGAFGLLESFSLFGVSILLVLDLLNVYRQPLFE
ncbi:hypothetical protein BV898_16500 [Hypsibius exemplaris]|uniref:MARVEL domain-containing protein n=1 Tax=Hypsibius exemplaris TaxID=2072580 RepID=A0A9X6RLP2_HYPEX|nr:hypothetical protein BV898_16500 [Hypsibius exemplaris]